MKAPSYGKRGGLVAFDRGSRKVSHAFGKAAYLTHGVKANGGIALECDSERLATHMLNLDPEVRSYRAQHLAVELSSGTLAFSADDKDKLRARAKRNGGKAVFYTPDFVVAWAGGTKTAIEVKLDRFPGDAEYQRKLQIAQNILFAHGYEFMQLVLPCDSRHALRVNLPLLHQAQMRRDLWPDSNIAERILALHAEGANSMGDYLRGLELDACMSPFLLVAGHLETDVLDHSLRFTTPAQPAQGDLSHLQLLRRFAR